MIFLANKPALSDTFTYYEERADNAVDGGTRHVGLPSQVEHKHVGEDLIHRVEDYHVDAFFYFHHVNYGHEGVLELPESDGLFEKEDNEGAYQSKYVSSE